MASTLGKILLIFGFFNALGVQCDEEKGKSWVLLVAGSSDWSNYRHQADVCHAYQIAKVHGIPDENIVVMMYDDIAHDESNPTPGVVINKPKGRDVYHGVPKDYTGENVKPSVFLDVLSGVNPNVGSQKVINSTSHDNVFVYFADHGAPGLIAFPDDVLRAGALNKTINHMKKHKRFNKLVLYVEACESGSMFDGILQKHENVYAMTASNPDQSSYACYFSEKYNTYLGDVFSVNWLEDADRESLKKETIEKQFHIVKKETNTSEVSQYGDKKIAKSHLSEFLGKSKGTFEKPSSPQNLTPMSSRSVSMDLVQRTNNKALIEFTKAKRVFMESVFEQIMQGIRGIREKEIVAIKNKNISLKDTNYDCYVEVVDAFHQKCFNLGTHSYALEFLKNFVNICYSFDKRDVLDSINKSCIHLRHSFGKIV